MPVDEDAVPWTLTSPRDAALRILADRFRPAAPLHTSVRLADFQRASFQRASSILQRRNGVLIADSVGLGKTFVALALIESALVRDRRVLVVVPACLRRMWRAELSKFGAQKELLHLVSHSQLATSDVFSSGTLGLVVVDEAHAFRNPGTQRYRALRRVCRASQVVLLTATPINNSLSDLYFQLRLFCSDGAFRDLGIGSLRSLVNDHARPQDLARLRQAVMVRGTRADARRALAARTKAEQSLSISPNATPVFRFPRDARTHALTYELPLAVAQIAAFLGRLTFPAYRVDRLATFSPDVLRFGLLKRMESSIRAIASTVQRQIRFYEQFVAKLEEGMLLRPRAFRSLYTSDDGALQLVLDAVMLERHTLNSDQHQLVTEARRELQTLREWRAAMSNAKDDKLNALFALLRARRPPAKTIVFSEYRDTARYLWSELRRQAAVGLIDGSGAWIGENQAARRHVVECFAPRANGGARVHAREAIDVLIATDVLAEGMNLQDADAVVSYDLPWNPVRLIQRAGRVDRIGSEHEVVNIYNFLPDREFDAFLGLARTIRSKLETVRGVVGVERAVLEPGEDFEVVARSIAGGSQGVLDHIDGDDQARLRAEYERRSPVPRDGLIPVASIAAGRPKRLLVGLVCASEWETRVVDLETGQESEGADGLLLRALEDRACKPVDVPAVLAVAERCVHDANQRPATASVPRTSAVARLARMIRRRLSELPLDAPAHTFERADAVLEQLVVVGDSGVENDLEELAFAGHLNSLHELIGALENVFSRRTNPDHKSARWVLTAVIATD